MKASFFCVGLLAGLLGPAASMPAQDPTAAAQREETETRFKNVETRIEQLEETLQLQLKKVNSLIAAIDSLSSASLARWSSSKHAQIDSTKSAA